MIRNELRDVPLEIETDRLVIRAPMPGVGAALFESIQASLPELKPWLPWAHLPMSAESVEAEAVKAYARFVTREDLRYQIFLSDGVTLIGGTGLHRIDWRVPRFEIGYWIDSRHTGNGYAREAAAALTDLAFERLGARRVEIRCEPLNERSAAIPKGLGFEFEGELRNWLLAADDASEARSLLVFSKIR